MLLNLVLTVFLLTVIPQVVFAQETNTVATGVDTTTAAASGLIPALAVGGIALLKDQIDKKNVTKNIKNTDVDIANHIALVNKFFQCMYVYKNYTGAQILDLPATNNPMDKTTLGQALAQDANGWATFVQEQYHVARPQMAIPSQSIVTATQNNVAPPTTQTTTTTEIKPT